MSRLNKIFVFLIAIVCFLFVSIGVSHASAQGDYTIHLKKTSFNPLEEKPRLDPSQMVRTEESRYFIVQLDGPVNKEQLEVLQESGAKPIEYIPNYAYISKLDPRTIRDIERISFVRWIGPYHPGYKMSDDFRKSREKMKIRIKVFEEHGNIRRVLEIIESMDGRILNVEKETYKIAALVDSRAVPEIAHIQEVEYIEPIREKITLMDNIRVLTGASSLHLNGYNGTGVVGEVKDNGYDSTHPEFDGQILGEDGYVTTEAHGTCTFGIIFAKGIDNKAKGMIPGGQGVFCDWDVSVYNSIQNLVNNWDGLFQSNSWAYTYTETGEYDTHSEDNDQAIYDYDVTMLYAAGNRDYGDYITTLSAAKNVICVGGIYHYNNQDWGDDNWGGSSCHGPAADGRIKPDLTAAYDDIYTTDIVGYGGYSYGDYYSNFGGTSGATPITAGAVGLVYEMYKENHFGNNPNGTVPHASTVKAILINHARQYPFNQSTRYQQGWGYPDVEEIYQNQDDIIIDSNYSLSTGENQTWDVLSNGSEPLKITLVWTDVPGAPSSSKHLKNDLSLKVTSPNGDVYWGNSGLINSHWSSPNGTEDHTNNVENVFIEQPMDATYAVEVIGTNIPEPVTNPEQNFSLVISGAQLRTIMNYTFSLYEGWNLITVPVANDYNASSLGQAIPGCTIVADWNASNNNFESFIVGQSPPSKVFPIEDGRGYFVYLDSPTNFSIAGQPLSNVSVPLFEGWNTIGWFKDEKTNASSIGNSIPNCTIVAGWDALEYQFLSYITGTSPPSADFDITQGMGLFAYVTSPSTWNGNGRNLDTDYKKISSFKKQEPSLP